ncbi:CyaA Adenylate cyclase, family 3 (some proteins contain HAMP domain) [Comamonadaceae bacterium]
MGVQSTVVFTDLHGSTAVFGALGNARATEAITAITTWIASLTAAHDGRLVKTLGDGVMVVFADSSKAIEFVVEVQRIHAKKSSPTQGGIRLPIRVGVASGDVEELAGDCYGDAVNVASRLCDLCGPNQIWASESVISGLLHLRGVSTRSLGPIQIRGRAEPVGVFQVEWREEEPSDFLTMQAQIIDDLGQSRDSLGKEVRLTMGEFHASFRSFELPVHIGRVKTAEFVVSDPRVSRTHAKLIWRNGGVILVDLSTYGTWVRFSDDAPGDILLRRDECVLHGNGFLALGASFADATAPTVGFEVR